MKAKKVIKTLKKVVFDNSFKATYIYTKYYEKNLIRDNEIVFQSFDGSSISGNVYYILLEICKDNHYSKFKKYIVANKEEYNNIKKFLKKKIKNKNIEIIKIHSRKYCKTLSRAKYLINNSTYPTYFIKKDKQIYINTWHGTPLKAMGRNIKNAPNELGNTQRNFLMADYLLYQNEFMFNKMKKDYMLDNLYKGEYLISGYPRNDAFYNETLKEKIKSKLGIQNKRIFIYMPTWRGSLINKENLVQYHYIMYMLLQLDKGLDDDTILYVKLHNYANSMINFEQFNHIKSFPKEYETYEFLNIADTLITDYSSVFFDYANTNRKIILFAYDKEEYLADRGLYINYNELPFTKVTSIKELLNEINNSESHKEYQEFYDEFCNYDRENCAKQICDYVFKRIKTDKIKVIQGKEYYNNKENVLLFGGALLKNGITTALKGIYNNVNLSKRNYFLTFYKNKVENNKQEINFFKNIDYIPIQGRTNVTIFESIVRYLYTYYNINNNFVNKIIDRIFKREIKRIYPGIVFKYAIHFTGYERNTMHLIKNMETKKIIFAHNDLLKEEKSKGNFHKNALVDAYRRFDNIVLVRDSMINNIQKYLREEDKNKVCIVHNLNNIDLILENSKKEIEFNSNTYSNIEINKLKDILKDKTKNKFINIARFSKEKGLDRLIRAFNKFQTENKDNYLIIIGGYGKQFEEIQDLIEQIENKNIILIKSLINPYPILNRCDCFVLSSHYEGLPMTIMEALILEKKVISTDIEGPREFLSKGYGYLVENSENGLINGFYDYINGKLNNLLKFDAKEFNDNALKEFENLFNKK